MTRIRTIIALFGVLIMSLIILLLFSRPEPFSGQTAESSPDLKVFIYENSEEPTRTQNLEKLFTHFRYDHSILGKGENWNGWYGRYLKYKNAIQDLNDDTFVLFCDGRDVLPNEDCSAFMKKAIPIYNRKPGSIIFNSEDTCCNVGPEFTGTQKEKKEYIDRIKRKFKSMSDEHNSPYSFLNFGIMFGKCSDFKTLFDVMDMQPGQDDQGLITMRIVNDEFNNFVLDHKHELFCIMFAEPKWDESKKMYLNQHETTHPSIFHFTGKTQWYETCANKLMQHHLNEHPLL